MPLRNWHALVWRTRHFIRRVIKNKFKERVDLLFLERIKIVYHFTRVFGTLLGEMILVLFPIYSYNFVKMLFWRPIIVLIPLVIYMSCMCVVWLVYVWLLWIGMFLGRVNILKWYLSFINVTVGAFQSMKTVNEITFDSRPSCSPLISSQIRIQLLSSVICITEAFRFVCTGDVFVDYTNIFHRYFACCGDFVYGK